jgi:hypothetical protein
MTAPWCMQILLRQAKGNNRSVVEGTLSAWLVQRRFIKRRSECRHAACFLKLDGLVNGG